MYRSHAHCTQAYGIIFVVDSSTPERFTEATNSLNEVMQSEKIVGKPLLVFANKQDQDNACNDTELANHLGLDQMLGINRQHSTVVHKLHAMCYCHMYQ